MPQSNDIVSVTVTLLGILVTALLVINQMILQRRLSYITSMLDDEEIIYWYKVLLKDLRFIYEALAVFPDLRIDEVTVAQAFNGEASRLKMEYLTSYIRDVLRGDERLGAKYPQLKERADKYLEPTEVFVPEYFPTVRLFMLSIMKGITFHPARPWFNAMFSPSQKRRDMISKLMADYKLMFSPKHILRMENEIRSFMLGRW